MIRKEDLKDMDVETYCDVNTCEECPRYGDDCDGSAELTLQTPQTYGKSINPSNAEVVEDYISRADAIDAIDDAIDADSPQWAILRTKIGFLPSAEAPPYCVLGQRPPWSEPKTWHEKNGHTYICGDCGFEQAIYGNINEYNCCPRCGVYKEYVDYSGIFPQKRTPHREDGEAE